MRWTDAETRVKRAFEALSHHDLQLLQNDANERTICARLATHLQAVFPEYHVDVEYNRHGMDPKRVEVDPEQGEELVYPDVIVHRRGGDEANLLVMELKKSTNSESRGRDRRKLRCCVEDFNYEFAMLVDIPIGDDRSPPRIERVHPPCS